jgi:hypothetical protein
MVIKENSNMYELENLNLSLQMIGERYENTNYKWWSTQGKYVAIDGDSKRDFIQF